LRIMSRLYTGRTRGETVSIIMNSPRMRTENERAIPLLPECCRRRRRSVRASGIREQEEAMSERVPPLRVSGKITAPPARITSPARPLRSRRGRKSGAEISLSLSLSLFCLFSEASRNSCSRKALGSAQPGALVRFSLRVLHFGERNGVTRRLNVVRDELLDIERNGEETSLPRAREKYESPSSLTRRFFVGYKVPAFRAARNRDL